jgi:hypothetical protein
MYQVPSLEQHNQLVELVEQLRADNQFLKDLLLAERWLTRKQAMTALNCKDSKLRTLTLNNSLTYRYEGKTPFTTCSAFGLT